MEHVYNYSSSEAEKKPELSKLIVLILFLVYCFPALYSIQAVLFHFEDDAGLAILIIVLAFPVFVLGFAILLHIVTGILTDSMED